MKRPVFFILIICLFLSLSSLCACAEDTGRTLQPVGSATQNAADGQHSGGKENYGNVDVDLSAMSGTVAYSQVYDMVYYPTRYEGKTVKMSGPFTVFYSSETELYYPAVIIKDATACCSQGIEFVLSGNPDYPNGYPNINSEITVVGKFEIYYERSKRFCHLVNATLV